MCFSSIPFPSCVDELRRRRRRHVLAGSPVRSVRHSAALRSLSRSGRRRRRRRSPLPSPVLYSPVFTDFDFLVRIRVLFDIRLLSWTDSIDDLAFFSPFFPYPAAPRRHLSPSRRPAGHVLARALNFSSSALPPQRQPPSSSSAASASCTSMRFCRCPPRLRGFLKRCLPSVFRFSCTIPGERGFPRPRNPPGRLSLVR